MIIDCQNCNKKFHIDQNLIPERGRLLQCSSCNHKWFFKNEIAVKTKEPIINESFGSFEIFESNTSLKSIPIINNKKSNVREKTITVKEKIVEKEDIKKNKVKKNINFLNLIIIFIISFVALIILLDTFKYPLGKIVPNLEFLLYNLFESIRDIRLFINDLI
tara:strand:- start:3545 stop:4030 length:486 start_codon:yes stop_codon:yes gene_type:complete